MYGGKISKLTLTVDPEVVRQAKEYAASQRKTALNGTIAKLAGIISEGELSELDSYTDYLQGKYQ